MADPKAQEAAENVGAAPQDASPLDALSPADIDSAKKVGEREVVAPGGAATAEEAKVTKAVKDLAAAEAQQRSEDPDAVVVRRVEDVRSKYVGGMSFDYGQRAGETTSELTDAQKVAADDTRLKRDNPDGVVVRTAGTSGEVGGETFTPGA